MSDQSAQTNGAEAYGKTVWSWHPLLVSSRRRQCWPNRVRQNLNPLTTVTRRIRRRGEHGISRKTIAQGMPECSVCTCMLVCVSFAHYCTRDRGCSVHPAFPAPSNFEGQGSGKPRTHRAARSQRIFSRHHPRRRVIQYSRDVDDRTDKPRRTGYPACAGYDGLLRGATPAHDPRTSSN